MFCRKNVNYKVVVIMAKISKSDKTKRMYYDDIFVAASMFKNHGVNFVKPENNGIKDVDCNLHKEMGKQVAYNTELTRGNNNDFCDWVSRARSFHDSAMVLASILENPMSGLFFSDIESYTLGKGNPETIYPSFFYISSHSIELLLKGVAIFSGKRYDELKPLGHDIDKILSTIKNTDYPFPRLSKGDYVILRNMSLVIGSGVVKYPNGKKNTNDIYKTIEESLIVDGIIRSDKEKVEKSPVGVILEKTASGYKVQEKIALLENSLNIETYKSLWNKIYKSLEKALADWMYAEGAFK